jgi:hypothetical protein
VCHAPLAAMESSMSELDSGWRREGGRTEVVVELGRVRAVRGGGGGTATAPAGGLLPTVVATPTS